VFQPAQRYPFVVEPHAVRELRPGEGIGLHNVVQEFNQLVGPSANLSAVCSCQNATQLGVHGFR
jgi:hypothetical protein